MVWFLPIVGILLALLALQDLFYTLFHPAEGGTISEYITLRVWRLVVRHAPKFRMFAGPFNFLLVILFWSASVVVGFALIYRPFMPKQFVVAPGMDPARLDRFISAFNLSLSNMITVNMGVQTGSAALQFAAGVEAVFGFAILTASISWLLSIYPVIAHRRSLAHEVSVLHFAEEKGIQSPDELSDSDLNTLLLGLAEQLITIRTEMSQFPITYYFQENEDRSALAPALFYLAQVAGDINKARAMASAVALGGTVDDLLGFMDEKYFGGAKQDRRSSVEAILIDHGREALRRRRPKKAA